MSDKPPQDVIEICLVKAWVGQGSWEHYEEFEDDINFVALLDGYTNLFLCLVVLVYILVQLFRRSKLSCLNWLGLVQLCLVNLLVGVSQFLESGNRMMSTNCHYSMNAVYGVEGLVCFNLATFIGYKIYLVCYAMAEFVTKGSLPTAASLKARKWCIFIIWMIAATFLVVYIGINIAWMVSPRDVWPQAQAFQLSFDVAHLLVYLAVSIFYFISALILYRMRKLGESDSTTETSSHVR